MDWSNDYENFRADSVQRSFNWTDYWELLSRGSRSNDKVSNNMNPLVYSMSIAYIHNMVSDNKIE